MACMEVENGWHDPRISFAVNLSHSDRTSQEKPMTQYLEDTKFDPNFEFCLPDTVSNGGSVKETLRSAAEFFADGQILAENLPFEAKTSTRRSPVRSASYPPSTPIPRNVSRKPSSRWKEMFKLSDQKSKEAEEETKEKEINGARPPPTPRSLRWPFSRSRSTGGEESRGNGLFCRLPFQRSNSARERKSNPGFASCYGRQTVGDVPSLKERDTLFGETVGFERGAHKPVTKVPDLRKGRGNEKTRVRNLEPSNAKAVMKSNSEASAAVIRARPVLNVAVGGSNGPGLFGFPSIKGNRYHFH